MAYMSDSYSKSKQAKLPSDTDLANVFDKVGQRNIIWKCSSNLNLFYQIKESNSVQWEKQIQICLATFLL